MYRLLALLLLVLIVALQMKLWQAEGEGSWTSEQALQRQVEEQRSENLRLKQRNTALEAEVEDLKTGETAVEERARSELGMVKPGEVFYRVVEPADPKANPRPEDVPEDAGSPASPASGSNASDASAAGSSTPDPSTSGSPSSTAPSSVSPSANPGSPASSAVPAGSQPSAVPAPRSRTAHRATSSAQPPNEQASKK